MSDNYCYVIYSNSHYNYLWQIINTYSKFLTNKLYLCIDENNSNFIFDKKFEIIYYKKELNYSHRLSKILDKINYKYILLIHDVDLILNINEIKINQIIDTMKTNNIDRVSLGVFKTNDIIINDSIDLCKINSFKISKSFFTPFDYSPSIYNTNNIKLLYNTFINETYVTLEQNQEVQKYVNNNFNVYGISSTKIHPIYHRGFCYSNDFNFLHITVNGKLLPLKFYFDLQDTVTSIVNKYNLSFLQTIQNIQNIDKNLL